MSQENNLGAQVGFFEKFTADFIYVQTWFFFHLFNYLTRHLQKNNTYRTTWQSTNLNGIQFQTGKTAIKLFRKKKKTGLLRYELKLKLI